MRSCCDSVKISLDQLRYPPIFSTPDMASGRDQTRRGVNAATGATRANMGMTDDTTAPSGTEGATVRRGRGSLS